MQLTMHLIPGLAIPGSPWHLAGLFETLPCTGVVVDVDRPAPPSGPSAIPDRLKRFHQRPPGRIRQGPNAVHEPTTTGGRWGSTAG